MPGPKYWKKSLVKGNVPVHEAAKRKLQMASSSTEGHGHGWESALQLHTGPKRRRLISDSSSSDDDDDDDDDGDDDDEDDEEDSDDDENDDQEIMMNLEKEMKKHRNVVSISRPSSYKRIETHFAKPARTRTKKPMSSMAMIAALNESSEEADSDDEPQVELTLEAQEEEAFSLYKKALELQRTGLAAQSQVAYHELLKTKFLSKVRGPDSERRGMANTAMSLKYSTYKNLGSLSAGKEDHNSAMEHYLEAVNLDGSDVTLWYKIGTVAVKLYHLALARVAFEQGLRCSKYHWPCLDNLCTVLYAINDYVTCLYYVAQALERDKHYTKGLAFRDQIYSEQPCLRQDCLDLFKHCDDEVFYCEVPKEKSKKVIDEALALRHERQKLAKDPPLPRIKLLQCLTEYKWKPLGERLVALYDHMTSHVPPLSLVTILDFENYKNKKDGPDVATEQDIQQEKEKKMAEMIARIVVDADQMTAKPQRSEQQSSVSMDEPAPCGDASEQGQMGTETGGDNPEQTRGEGPPMQLTIRESPALLQDGGEERLTQECPDGVETEVGKKDLLMHASALTLKQLAEALLRKQNLAVSRTTTTDGVADSTEMFEEVKPPESTEPQPQQLPPDSTSEQTNLGLDSSTGPAEVQAPFCSVDTTAASSQDTSSQSGKEAGATIDSTDAGSKEVAIRRKPGRPKLLEDSVSMDTEDSHAEKSRRGPKKKRMLRDEPAPGKRRSARVRNTTNKKKEEEEMINYADLLRQFLPSTLLVSDDEDDDGQILHPKTSASSASNADAKKTADTIARSETPFIATEMDDVYAFLSECQLNSGIIDVMSRYLERLVARHALKWPAGLASVFLEVYRRLRKHITLPELLCCDEDESVVRDSSLMCLLSAEINLDQCLMAKKNTSTPVASPATVGGTPVCTYNWGPYHEEDMMYLQELTLMQYMLPSMWPMVPARVYWFKARYYIQIGKMSEAEDAFERCKDALSREEERRKEGKEEKEEGSVEEMETDAVMVEEVVEVIVTNVKHGGVISVANINSEVESLQRCQSLEQLQRLHSAGNHGKVAELLRPTLLNPSRGIGGKVMGMGNTSERCSQLLLLVQSLMELKDYKDSVICCILSVCEAWQGVRAGGLQTYHQLWLETLNTLLSHLDKALLSCAVGSLGGGGANAMRKAASVLIKIIEWCMESSEVTDLTNATSVMPWVVLYHIIKYEEDHLAAKSLPPSDFEGVGQRSRSPSPIPMLPSSLMLLETAHDYLGRRSWCCNCNGSLLKLYVRVLWGELAKYSEENQHPFYDDLRLTLEQCFYCLHGHPTRKAKTRHLQDHAVPEVPMEWSNCSYIFDYFKPKVFPEFDSYKTSSMSSELEGLLLKISRVIPLDAKPANGSEALQGYIDGVSDKTPALPEGVVITSTVIKELYYLLADYYFKNREFGKAIRFYHQDLCVCPNRLDSWAGLALARTGRLDLKLNNSSDAKTEGPIFKHGVAALRCFQRALEIDATNYSLWIEYGTQAYILHSHASRQIKQREQLGLDDVVVETLRVKQTEMLDIAEHCFQQASLCEGDGDEEEWLVHYMLGKVAEKRSAMEDCLGHYIKASYHLHEVEARYPKKITYHNPPELSLEALEMYFRIHASILKLLQCSKPGSKVKMDGYATLDGLIQEASHLPFVRAEEKKRDPSSEHSTDTEQESKMRLSKLDTPTQMTGKTTGSPVFIATPQDHDYLQKKYQRTRSRVSSQEDNVTDTASESELFSGDEGMAPFLTTQRSSITLRPVPARRAQSAAEAAMASLVLERGSEAVQQPAPLSSSATGNAEMREAMDTVTDTIANTVTESQAEPVTDTGRTEGGDTDTQTRVVTDAEQSTSNNESTAASQGGDDAEGPDDTAMSVEDAQIPSIVISEASPENQEEKYTSDAAASEIEFVPQVEGQAGSSSEEKNEQGQSVEESEATVRGQMETQNREKVLARADGDVDCEALVDVQSQIEAKSQIESKDAPNQVDVQGETEVDNDKNEESNSEDKQLVAESSVDHAEAESSGIISKEGMHVDDGSDIAMVTDDKEDGEEMEVDATSEEKIEEVKISDKVEGKKEHVDDDNKTDQLINDKNRIADEVTGVVSRKDDESDDFSHQMDVQQVDAVGGNKVVALDIKEAKHVGTDERQDEGGAGNKGEVNKSSRQPDDAKDEKISDKISALDQVGEKMPEQTDVAKDDATTKKPPESTEEVPEHDGSKRGADQNQEGADGGQCCSKENDDEEVGRQHVKLIEACVNAMKLCLQRFPQHYKAAYRMAHLYAYAPTHKNLSWSRDILISGGSTSPRPPSEHMVAPGLFSEHHKSKNLFHGIWRIPIHDIDRSGSFPWHMYRSVVLLIHVLRELQDHAVLLQVAMKLYRTPDSGKKYLRDADRLFLARDAFDAYIATTNNQIASPSGTEEERVALVLSAYRCVQITQVKLPSNTYMANDLLVRSFLALKGDAIDSEPTIIEQALRFCTHYITFHKLPHTPTHADVMPSRGFHKEGHATGGSRYGQAAESRRLGSRSWSDSERGRDDGVSEWGDAMERRKGDGGEGQKFGDGMTERGNTDGGSVRSDGVDSSADKGKVNSERTSSEATSDGQNARLSSTSQSGERIVEGDGMQRDKAQPVARRMTVGDQDGQNEQYRAAAGNTEVPSNTDDRQNVPKERSSDGSGSGRHKGNPILPGSSTNRSTSVEVMAKKVEAHHQFKSAAGQPSSTVGERISSMAASWANAFQQFLTSTTGQPERRHVIKRQRGDSARIKVTPSPSTSMGHTGDTSLGQRSRVRPVVTVNPPLVQVGTSSQGFMPQTQSSNSSEVVPIMTSSQASQMSEGQEPSVTSGQPALPASGLGLRPGQRGPSDQREVDQESQVTSSTSTSGQKVAERSGQVQRVLQRLQKQTSSEEELMQVSNTGGEVAASDGRGREVSSETGDSSVVGQGDTDSPTPRDEAEAMDTGDDL